MPLTDEAKEMFANHIGEWFDRQNVPSHLRIKVFDPTIKKPRMVVQVRDALIEWLRTECWQERTRLDHPVGHGGFLADQKEPGGTWIPLSRATIADVMGLSEGAIYASLKRTREKLQLQEVEQRNFDSFSDEDEVESRHDAT